MKFFLDIDGVMVHANPRKSVELEEDGFYKFNRIAINILNSVIDPNSDDEIILSTSHRFRFDVEEWTRIFHNRGILAPTISILALVESHKSSRISIILRWIVMRELALEDIVIIDDDKSLNDLPDLLKERLVLTNSYTGLDNSSDLDKILKNRKKQLI